MSTRTPRIRPARKRFGQHFLEPAWVDKVVRAIEPAAGDTFLEIGPGRGALTWPLAARAGRVVAFEIDRDLVADLDRDRPANATIVAGNFLETTATAIRAALSDRDALRAIRVAGNLPYNVGSPILFRLIELAEAGLPLADAHLMLQREVADRLVATPSTADYGVLSVLIGHRAAVDRVLSLPPGAFRPAPKVRSALVRLRFHPPDPPVRDLRLFDAMVRRAFTRRRKMLDNALAPEHRRALAAASIDGRRRPETLTLVEFARLTEALAEPG
ncbi:MAG: ribosomal RNA small subunit methyltransferase A [Acidobacteria bacterium]|nr:ribosomal RNA small subunit methyltransferase A [Acidobacteriota bacterium]